MDLLGNLLLGLETTFQPWNLFYCFVGTLLGTLIGVLPGIGPSATIAMLLPVTFALSPVTSMIMLAGIYYGAQYGGSTTAILLNMPGEASSAVTAMDGYEMAKQGRAGLALATAAIGSFFAGTVATVFIGLFALPLTSVALAFTSVEYFSLVVLGLMCSVLLSSGSPLKAIAMVISGILLGLVGMDMYTAIPRFTFGILDLDDGLEFNAVVIGIYGIAEILRNLENEVTGAVVAKKIRGIIPTRDDWRQIRGPIVRGTAIGSVLGILPGGGATLSAFAAYATEKKLAKDPTRFGRGAIEGVAGPESANNAGAQTAFIPMLTLGIPSNGVLAIMIGAMILHGIQPGPNVANEQPELFWGIIASMWAGNLMLLVLNLPLIGIWVRLLTIPYYWLFPAILVFCALGVFSVNNNGFDIVVLIGFALFGYFMYRLNCEPTPFILGFVLGPMLEEHFRRAMITSRGDPTIFLTHPISAMLLAIAAVAIAVMATPAIARRRREVFVEDD